MCKVMWWVANSIGILSGNISGIGILVYGVLVRGISALASWPDTTLVWLFQGNLRDNAYLCIVMYRLPPKSATVIGFYFGRQWRYKGNKIWEWSNTARLCITRAQHMNNVTCLFKLLFVAINGRIIGCYDTD